MNQEMFWTAVVASACLAFIVERVIKPIVDIVVAFASAASPVEKREAFRAFVALWPFYVSLITMAYFAWWTGINLFPVFSESQTVGRVLSCIAIGLGPSSLYDLAHYVRSFAQR